MSFKLPRFVTPEARNTLRPPEREVALRRESIASSKTTLVLRSKGDAKSAVAYRVTTEEGKTVYTVSGRNYGDRGFREFHDSSGLPLFELHTKTRLGFLHNWFLTMPGGGDVKIAELEHWLVRDGQERKKMKFSFRNMAANDTKDDEEKALSLDIESYGQIMARYDIIDGDRRIAGVYESIHHNDTLALLPSSRRKPIRPAVDLTVVPGVDTSLVSL